MKHTIKRMIAKAGYELRRTNRRDFLLLENDEFYGDLYQKGSLLTGTPDGGDKRFARFYNLVQFFSFVGHLQGAVAECGCWRGLSSYLLCHYAKLADATFVGDGYEIYDSFEGLSVPISEDKIRDLRLISHLGEIGGQTGNFAASDETVRISLADFPKIEYVKGWIPDVFRNRSAIVNYKFVHVDLDLYAPTKGAISHFFPMLVKGGILVCDDYGSLRWPGAKRAVDEYCCENKVGFVPLSTGQAVLFKA